MKSFKLVAFMALVGIGQTMICSDEVNMKVEWTKEQDEYAQKLQKRINKMTEDRMHTPSALLAHILPSKRKEVADAAFGELCNILHEEEFQHCPNTIFAKFRPAPECLVVRDFIALTLKYNPQMPDTVEKYNKSRERFHAVKKAVQ